MNKLFPFLACAALTLGALGCAEESDETNGDNSTPAQINEQAVGATASTAFSAAQTAVVDGEGQSAAFAMMGVGLSALSLVTPGAAQQAVGDIGQVAQRQDAAGTCECDAGSCTFEDCGDGSGYTISGSIAWTDTSLDCDYSVGGSDGVQSFNYEIFCDLDYTATSLDGVLQTRGDIQAQGASTAFDTDLTFNMVEFDGNGAVSGSIDVSASVSYGGQSYSSSATVEFPVQ